MKIFFSLVIVRTVFLSVPSSEEALVFGRSTSTPCVISGAVTMKMISKTSMTSTSGVTLMSLTAFPRPPPDDMPMVSPPQHDRTARKVLTEEVPLHDVEKIRGESVHFGLEHPDPRQEVVVRDHGRNRGRQTCS